MVSYERIGWVNGTGSPLNASNLNKIDDGILELVKAVNENTDNITKNTNAIDVVDDKADELQVSLNNVTTTVNTVKDTQAAQDTRITTNTNNISLLINTVGDDESGLVKDVNALKTNSATKTDIANTNKNVTNLNTALTTLQGTVNSLDSDITNVETNVSNLTTRVSTAEENIRKLETNGGGTGGGASTWEDITGKPDAYTPNVHTSSNPATYGAATSSLYGHVKLDSGDMAGAASTNGIAAGRGHTHSNLATKDPATADADGLLSAEDKEKLDGIESGANNYVLPNIINESKVESTGTTVAFSIGEKKFSQVVAVDGGSLSVGSAEKLTTARTIELTGDVTGSAVFDGSVNATITTTVADDCHNHSASTITSGTLALARIPTGTTSTTVALGNHTHSSYVNQNAFSNITIGSTTIAADSTTDTVTLVAGDNVTLTPDATNDKITISATDTNTTYSAGAGISLSGTTFSNSGVRSVKQNTSDGHKLEINTGGTTATITIPDSDTKYSAGTGISLSGTTFSNSGVRSITQDKSDGHKLTINTGGTTATITIPDSDTTYSFSANTPTLEWGKTATIGTAGGTTYKVTMPANPDTDTTYSAGTGLSLSGTTFNNNGVISITQNADDGHELVINTGGTTSYIQIPDNNTTYGIATSSTAGLVKSGGDVTVGTDGKMTVADDSHNHTISNIDGLQDLLDLLNWKSF